MTLYDGQIFAFRAKAIALYIVKKLTIKCLPHVQRKRFNNRLYSPR
jgi:hypothetical protein